MFSGDALSEGPEEGEARVTCEDSIAVQRSKGPRGPRVRFSLTPGRPEDPWSVGPLDLEDRYFSETLSVSVAP